MLGLGNKQLPDELAGLWPKLGEGGDGPGDGRYYVEARHGAAGIGLGERCVDGHARVVGPEPGICDDVLCRANRDQRLR